MEPAIHYKVIQIILVLSIYMLFASFFISIFKRKDETDAKGASTGLGTILGIIWRFIYLTTLIIGIIMLTLIFISSL